LSYLGRIAARASGPVDTGRAAVFRGTRPLPAMPSRSPLIQHDQRLNLPGFAGLATNAPPGDVPTMDVEEPLDAVSGDGFAAPHDEPPAQPGLAVDAQFSPSPRARFEPPVAHHRPPGVHHEPPVVPREPGAPRALAEMRQPSVAARPPAEPTGPGSIPRPSPAPEAAPPSTPSGPTRRPALESVEHSSLTRPSARHSRMGAVEREGEGSISPPNLEPQSAKVAPPRAPSRPVGSLEPSSPAQPVVPAVTATGSPSESLLRALARAQAWAASVATPPPNPRESIVASLETRASAPQPSALAPPQASSPGGAAETLAPAPPRLPPLAPPLAPEPAEIHRVDAVAEQPVVTIGRIEVEVVPPPQATQTMSVARRAVAPTRRAVEPFAPRPSFGWRQG
jgi:hypothetical protein